MIETILRFMDYVEDKSEVAVSFIVFGAGIIAMGLILGAAYILIKFSAWLLLLIPLVIWLCTVATYIYKYWKENK